jgi:hypothetical protein
MSLDFNPGTRDQLQYFDTLAAEDLYIPNAAGVLTRITASADDLNAKGERIIVGNKTSGALAAGTLVYINGFDTTLGCPTVIQADADAPEKIAQFILPAAIADGETGYVEASYVITDLNTSGASAVGSPVYLSATAGGWTVSAPTGDRVVQVVGIVKVKHASTGSIYFFPGETVAYKVGTSGLQDAAITADKLAAAVAGTGLAGGAGTALSVDLNELSGATISVSADSLPFVDATDNSTKLESVADLATGMADNVGIAASAGVLSIKASGVTKGKLAGGFSKVTLAAGTDSGANVTLAGIASGDELVSVMSFTTAASIATVADRTAEYAVGSGVLTKAAGTDERNNQLIIFWNDLTA